MSLDSNLQRLRDAERKRAADKLARQPDPDKAAFENWQKAFDRFAFKGHYRDEQLHMGTKWSEDGRNLFDIAIEDTGEALWTGHVALGKPPKILSGKGAADITNPDRRQQVEVVRKDLAFIRARLVELRKLETKQPPTDEDGKRIQSLVEEIDGLRDKIITTMNDIWRELDIPTLPIPTQVNWDKYPGDYSKV